MKTVDLIEILAADGAAKGGLKPAARLVAGLAGGGLISLALVVFWLKCQPLDAAARHGWFWMKLGYTGSLTLAAGLAAVRLALPGRRLGRLPLWSLAAIVLMFALRAAQVALFQTDGPGFDLLGSSWRVCTPLILLLTVPIFVVVTAVLKTLAPTHLAAAGGAAGAASAALAASLYGLHCTEQNPAFIAAWYTLAIVTATLIGAATGPRLLRW